jgi:hypothetical protein
MLVWEDMAKAVFLAGHTFSFAAGILLAAVVTFLLRPDSPTNQGADAIAIMIIALFAYLFALMEAALFSLGCAWGGVPRLPKPRWALLAGIAVGAGFVVYGVLMRAIPAPVDLESHKQQGIYGAIAVVYSILAPIIAGLLCAWVSRRAR